MIYIAILYQFNKENDRCFLINLSIESTILAIQYSRMKCQAHVYESLQIDKVNTYSFL